MHIVQELASGKIALGVSVGTATSPAWVNAMHSETAAAVLMIIGGVLSLTILVVNMQAFFYRAADRAERKRNAALRAEVLKKDLGPARLTEVG